MPMDEELVELIARLDENDERCDLCIMRCKYKNNKTGRYPCDDETRRRFAKAGRRYLWEYDGLGHWERVV